MSATDSRRVILFTYGDFVPIAVELLREVGADVVGVVLASNRRSMDAPSLALFDPGVPVLLQPPRKQIIGFLPQIAQLQADFFFVWTYSMILPPELLCMAPQGVYNMHSGELPGWRGGHTMQWAILLGETHAGISLHRMDEGIDTGPVLGVERVPIGPNDTVGTVHLNLLQAGRALLHGAWTDLSSGFPKMQPQDESRARYFRLINDADGAVNWHGSVRRVRDQVRGLTRPWSGAHTSMGEQRWQIWATDHVWPGRVEGVPGQILAVPRGAEGWLVQASDGVIEIPARSLEAVGGPAILPPEAGECWDGPAVDPAPPWTGPRKG
jgi:methionyl-tRNA formyltransferase